MILLKLILILVAGGIIAWITGMRSRIISRIITIVSLVADLVIVASLLPLETEGKWLVEYSASWIPQAGIGMHLAADGLSLIMLALTFFIGLIAVIVPVGDDTHNPGFYYFNLLLCLAGIAGVFLSADLFLFYFFWELMIVPMYFIIAIWGNGNSIKASYKFFIYTQAGGLLMFLSVIGLYIIHGKSTGLYTFDIGQLAGTVMSRPVGLLLMAGFLAAFLVKLPAFLLHTWLPDAYTEAPLAGTIILASLMSKTAAYGLIRFAMPLFPVASQLFAPFGMALGVAGILYGAMLAFSQTDLKRLIAYTSLSHMGFIVLGVYSFNEIAYQGVVMQMIAHGLSTCAMFVVAYYLQRRLDTRDIGKMGGLWDNIPALGSMGMIFSMALLGLPGLGNFIAEFLTLAGSFTASILFTSIACLGLVLSTVYSLRIMQRIFFGKKNTSTTVKDLTIRESVILGVLVIAVVLTGLFPQPLIDKARPAVLRSVVSGVQLPDELNNGSTVTEVKDIKKQVYGQD